VKSFLGEFVVGSSCLTTNPIRWAKMAKEELENRGIPYLSWVKQVKSCMSPEVLDSFRIASCSNYNTEIAIRILSHKNIVEDLFECTMPTAGSALRLAHPRVHHATSHLEAATHTAMPPNAMLTTLAKRSFLALCLLLPAY
jgi:hypothetical protein